MKRKHAAVVGGEYREWYEDEGPQRVRPDLQRSEAGVHNSPTGGRQRPMVQGAQIQTPPLALSSRATSDCCGLMQSVGNPCVRCFTVVWYRERVA